MRSTLSTYLMSTLLAAATLFGTVSPSFAGGLITFNDLANDAEFLTGNNVTQNQSGFSDPVQGKAGDEIDVAVYYHNTVPGSDAKNTRIRIQLPTGFNMSNVLKGTLSADNAETVTGTIVDGVETGRPDLTIQSQLPTRVDFVKGSVRWYPDRVETKKGNERILPSGQTGDSIVTTGINLGDIAGCFQYSGYVIFTVKLTGQTVVEPKGNLVLTKEVRRAGSTEAFKAENQVNPGEAVEYRITVRNNDGAGVARNVRLIDSLETGLTYVPGSTKRELGGVTTDLPDGITSSNGIIVAETLQPLTTLVVTFRATTETTATNTLCRRNVVRVQAENSTVPGDATALTCYVVPTPTPTPTPTPSATPVPTPTPVVPKPTPTPTLPSTGGDLATLAGILGASLTAGGVTMRQLMNRRALKKQSRNVTIV